MQSRARDHIEFNYISFSSGVRDRGLQVSVSYKAKKGAIPDIDSLVVNIPEVKFPKNLESGAEVLTWKGLVDKYLYEVRYPVISQVTRSIWSKVTWRKRGQHASGEGGAFEEQKEETRASLASESRMSLGQGLAAGSKGLLRRARARSSWVNDDENDTAGVPFQHSSRSSIRN
mmetsp:Transcript_61914/g.141741  ORF Transcript_61914/g.141741 Transcript_61914/m.141741 type:complete len:173 (+) Transcript_61914:51-569(+)